MMAELDIEKTEAPTLLRRRQAREQGQVARSSDLSAAAMLLAGLYLLKWFGPDVLGAMKIGVADLLGSAGMADLSTDFAWRQVLHLLAVVGVSLAPIMAGLVGMALAANLMQVGFRFNFARLTPNLELLSPGRGLGRIFAAANAMHLAMTMLKVILVTWLAYSAIATRLPQMVAAQQLGVTPVCLFAAGTVFAIALRIGTLLLVLGLLDYAYQRYRLERDLRMTRQEVKEEMKRMEGDPMFKQRRRKIAAQLALPHRK